MGMNLAEFSEADRAAGQSVADAWEQAFVEHGEALPVIERAEQLTLDRFGPIVFGRSGYNVVDAAVAKPT